MHQWNVFGLRRFPKTVDKPGMVPGPESGSQKAATELVHVQYLRLRPPLRLSQETLPPVSMRVRVLDSRSP